MSDYLAVGGVTAVLKALLNTGLSEGGPSTVLVSPRESPTNRRIWFPPDRMNLRNSTCSCITRASIRRCVT